MYKQTTTSFLNHWQCSYKHMLKMLGISTNYEQFILDLGYLWHCTYFFKTAMAVSWEPHSNWCLDSQLYTVQEVLEPFYIVTYHVKCVKTSWTHSNRGWTGYPQRLVGLEPNCWTSSINNILSGLCRIFGNRIESGSSQCYRIWYNPSFQSLTHSLRIIIFL